MKTEYMNQGVQSWKIWDCKAKCLFNIVGSWLHLERLTLLTLKRHKDAAFRIWSYYTSNPPFKLGNVKMCLMINFVYFVLSIQAETGGKSVKSWLWTQCCFWEPSFFKSLMSWAWKCLGLRIHYGLFSLMLCSLCGGHRGKRRSEGSREVWGQLKQMLKCEKWNKRSRHFWGSANETAIKNTEMAALN